MGRGGGVWCGTVGNRKQVSDGSVLVVGKWVEKGLKSKVR
jgi:hypothetical protein